MKHPVDTSSWGEFKLKDIAKLTNGNKFDKNKMARDNASVNFVSRTGFNNGISDFVDIVDGVEPYPAGAITLALGGSVGSTFVQTAPFYTGQNVGVIEFENKPFFAKQFVAGVLAKTCSLRFSAFKNEINQHFKRDLSIPLPLKPCTDLSNYDQDDIDWDYMEDFMSKVQEKANQRLETLPEPGQMSKTPVDVSGWGEFKLDDLFTFISRGTRIRKQERIKGDIPLVTAGYENQGVAEHISQNKELFTGVCLTIDMFGNAFARNYDFYADDNILVFRKQNMTFAQALFIASSLSYLQTIYNYTNQFRQQSIDKTHIKLPLKPGTDLSNYDQDDIDWDYMEDFMSKVQEKANQRLEAIKSLTNS